MRKLILISIASLAAFLLASCRQSTVIGSPRILEVNPVDGPWPSGSSMAITRTYQVRYSGAGDEWTVALMDGTQGFVLTTNYLENQFTVSIDENPWKDVRIDYAVVTYSGEMKYVALMQASDWLYVDEGLDMGGYRAYTVASDGTSTYSGILSLPGGGELTANYVSGYNGFKYKCEDGMLSFSAPANKGFVVKKAVWEIGCTSKPGAEVLVNVEQDCLVLPQAAQVDETAVGGYYYPLLCGVDVCGVNVVEYNGVSIVGRSWNNIFDPEATLTAKPSANQDAPVNPCPSGWNAPTEAQMRLIGSTEEGVKSWVWDNTAERNPGDTYFYWVMQDGSHSKGDIFGGSYSCVAHFLASSQTRAGSDGQYWRLLINRSSSVQVVVASQARTTLFKDPSENQSTIIRCVRNHVNNED